jgi:hypothetical protein
VILRNLAKEAANSIFLTTSTSQFLFSITPVFKNFVDFLLVVKRPKREADYRHPSTSELKNKWSYTSTHGVGRGKIVLVLCNISLII